MIDSDPEASSFQKLFEAEEEAGLAVLDEQGRVRVANGAMARLAGRAPLAGEAAEALFLPESRAAVAAAVAAALAGPPAPPVLMARLDNAGLPPDAATEVHCRPLRGEPGALMRVTDVTARRRMQAQLEEGARLQSVGQLAGGVAHDFNNLLAAIAGAAESALSRGPDAETAEDLRQILDSAGRGARLVRQLLAFASRQALAPRILALDAAVEALVPLLRRLLPSRLALEVVLERPVPRVRVDPSQLDQALLNLVVNARDAMPAGGTIRIVLRQRALAEELAEQGAVVPPGAWALLEVIDQGGGIPADALPRIFEPFFTTRRETGGTGLGLPTVRGVLRQSGGHVSVETAPGRGTCFRLWFPVAEGEPEPAAAAGPAAPVEARARRVLLVDDEPPLRMMAERFLRAAGHEVRAAEDAETALAVLEEGFEPEVLVSDVTMPGEMDGIGLAEALRARLPHLAVVLVSGYAEGAVGEGLSGRGVRFLEKPFRMAELAVAVAEAAPEPA